jgi:NAD(P)-dependent dehydrogenase (short-subunit alcohol dehydrogenase family)
MSSFLDKVVVITGGAGILCRAMGKAFAEKGAKVALLDINEEAAKQAAEEINRNGFNVAGIHCDVLNIDSLKKAHEKILTAFGSCDILVNGAGGNHPKATTSASFFDPNAFDEAKADKTFFNLDINDIKSVFDLNFFGSLLPIQEFSGEMVAKKNASIITISSMNASRPLTKIPAYSSAKAAISNFTQWLAVYFAKTGIRVNAIAPGFFLTEQTKFLLTDEEGNLTERGTAVIAHTPAGRFGVPEDLLSTLFWLCAEESGFVTGIVVPVDGGFSAYSGV